MTLQVQIRQAGGGDVSLDDCASFSGPMGEALDSSTLLKEAYVLEISSPGIDDHLSSERDFETFKGFPIEVLFRDQQGSEHHQTGLLHEKTKEHLHINIKGRINRLRFDEVISVQLCSPST